MTQIFADNFWRLSKSALFCAHLRLSSPGLVAECAPKSCSQRSQHKLSIPRTDPFILLNSKVCLNRRPQSGREESSSRRSADKLWWSIPAVIGTISCPAVSSIPSGLRLNSSNMNGNCSFLGFAKRYRTGAPQCARESRIRHRL